ncbi:protein-export chaperone SecB [Mariprofundus ferrooxydans]|uniref:protein-export chaperone SecB n=1 Tax=Mariprofundus ferrooxydans TaxID=314344 RepID=UPI0006A71B45|nr:protein-export chaperone SecB [Mariprofundus ferrooxydans]
MGNALLMNTAKNLMPLGVFLRKTSLYVQEDFNRHHCNEAELDVLFKSSPGSQYKALLSEDEAEGVMLFQFEAGVRLIDPLIDESSDDFLKVEILATFEAEYQLVNIDGFDEDGMSHFLNRNVPHHVWPYWREFVQSTCSRIGIPEIVVPFRIIASVEEDSKDDHE